MTNKIKFITKQTMLWPYTVPKLLKRTRAQKRKNNLSGETILRGTSFVQNDEIFIPKAHF